MAIFKIKQKDTLPYLRYQLVNSDDGTPYILEGDETVAFFLREDDGAMLTLTGTASIFDALTGVLEYSFSSADTTLPGIYEAEFQLTKGANKITVPADRSLFIQIYDDINE